MGISSLSPIPCALPVQIGLIRCWTVSASIHLDLNKTLWPEGIEVTASLCVVDQSAVSAQPQHRRQIRSEAFKGEQKLQYAGAVLLYAAYKATVALSFHFAVDKTFAKLNDPSFIYSCIYLVDGAAVQIGLTDSV